MLWRVVLEGVEIRDIQRRKAESIEILALQRGRVTGRNALTRDSINRQVIVASSSPRTDGKATPKVDHAQHFEAHFSTYDLHLSPYLPSIEKASTTLPGMKPSEP